MLFQFVAECRGSQVDSDNRSWIEDSRSLPDEDLSYIAARFCEDDPVLIQVSYSKKLPSKYQGRCLLVLRVSSYSKC